MSISQELIDWNRELRLDDPYFYVNDNRALFQRMQREVPVFWYEPGQFWAITKYNDIRTLMQDPAALSNTKGTLINSRGDDWAENYLAKSGRRTLVFTDPPEHTQLKSALLQLLSPRKIRAMQEHMEQVIHEVLDKAPKHTPFDFAEDFAGRLPADVVASLIDVPSDIYPKFFAWAQATRDSTEFSETTDWDAITRTLEEMHAYFKAFVTERRAQPGDDFVSGLLAIEVNGIKLSDEWILGLCGTLVSGGYESAKSFIMSAANILFEHQDQRQLLIQNPELWPSAMDELFRFIAPSNGVARYVLKDINVRGVTIRKGQWIVFLLGAGNVDEDIWPNALDLDLQRPPKAVTTFGAGPHLCIGNILARIECRLALRILLERFPRYKVVGNPQRRPSVLSNSFNAMPVILAPLDA